jgi:predicted nucleotidyltransferase
MRVDSLELKDYLKPERCDPPIGGQRFVSVLNAWCTNHGPISASRRVVRVPPAPGCYNARTMGLRERYEEILRRLLAGLRAHYGSRLVSVAVFGSVARQTQREDSDIDFLIVARDLPPGRSARVDEFLPVEQTLEPWLAPPRPDLMPVGLSPVFKTLTEVEAGSPLFLDMVEDARILHDEDDFLAGRLERLRQRLAALGAQRVWRGNAWYWILKPDLEPGEIISL